MTADLTGKIMNQVSIALKKLGAPMELLAAVNSYGDTLDDEDVLDLLEDFNSLSPQIRSLMNDPERLEKLKVENEKYIAGLITLNFIEGDSPGFKDARDKIQRLITSIRKTNPKRF